MLASDSDLSLENKDDDIEMMRLEQQNLIELDDFVLVQIAGKRTKTYYVGQIVEVSENTVKTKFMRRADMSRGKQMSFVFDDREDETGFSHNKEDIILKLPTPSSLGATKRCASKLVFPCSLQHYDPL